MLKIFLSSTYRDLAEYRSKILEKLNAAFEGVGMEQFIPDGSNSQEVCIGNLKKNDVVIFLISSYYGSLMESCSLKEDCKAVCPMKTGENQISYTHCEYKTTVAEGILHQTYLIEKGWDNIPADIKNQALEFKKEIGKEYLGFIDIEDPDLIQLICSNLATKIIEWHTQDKLDFTQFCDREKVFNELIETIDSKVEVWGVGGVGKTALIELALLIQKLKGKRILTIGTSKAYASGSGLEDFRTKCKDDQYIAESRNEITIYDVINALAENKLLLDAEEVSKMLKEEKIAILANIIRSEENLILFIDDFHLANDDVVEVVKSVDHIILSSRKNTYIARKEIYLSGIDKKDRENLIKLFSTEIPENIRKSINQIAEGHPVSTELLVKNYENIDFDKLKDFNLEDADDSQVRGFYERVIEEIFSTNKQALVLLKDLAILNTDLSTNINRESVLNSYDIENIRKVFKNLVDTGMLKKRQGSEGIYEFYFKHIQDYLEDEAEKDSHEKAIEYYKKKASEYGDNINNKVEVLSHKVQLNPTAYLIKEFVKLSREIKPKNQGYKRLIEVGEKLNEKFSGNEKGVILKTLGNLYIYLNRFQTAEEKYKDAAKITDNLEQELNENINNLLQSKGTSIYDLYEDFKANYISLNCKGKIYEKSPWIKLKEHLLDSFKSSDGLKIKKDLRQIFLFFMNIIGFDTDKKNFFHEAKALSEIIVDKNTINLERAFSCTIYNQLCLTGNNIQEPIEKLALKAAQLYQSWASNYKKEKETITYIDVLEMVAWHYYLAKQYEESAEKYLELSHLRDEDEEVDLLKIIYHMAATNFEACQKQHQAGEMYYKLAMLMEESQKFSELAIEYFQNALSKIDKSSYFYGEIEVKLKEAEIKVNKLKKELSEKESKKALFVHNQYDKIAVDIIASHLYVNNVDCYHGIPDDFEDYLSKDGKFDYIILFGSAYAPQTGFFSQKMFGNEKNYVKLYNTSIKYGNVWIIQRKSRFFLVAGTTANFTVKSANMFVNGSYL